MRWINFRIDIYFISCKNSSSKLYDMVRKAKVYQYKFTFSRDILNTAHIKTISLLISEESLLVKENPRSLVPPQ